MNRPGRPTIKQQHFAIEENRLDAKRFSEIYPHARLAIALLEKITKSGPFTLINLSHHNRFFKNLYFKVLIPQNNVLVELKKRDVRNNGMEIVSEKTIVPGKNDPTCFTLRFPSDDKIEMLRKNGLERQLLIFVNGILWHSTSLNFLTQNTSSRKAIGYHDKTIGLCVESENGVFSTYSHQFDDENGFSKKVMADFESSERHTGFFPENYNFQARNQQQMQEETGVPGGSDDQPMSEAAENQDEGEQSQNGQQSEHQDQGYDDQPMSRAAGIQDEGEQFQNQEQMNEDFFFELNEENDSLLFHP